MNLKIKTISIVGFVSLFLVFTLFLSLRFVILDTFSQLERNKALQDDTRAVMALNKEIDYIEAVTIDWAEWDETYKFIENYNDVKYIEDSLSEATYYNQKLNVVMFMNIDGEVVYSKSYIYESKKQIETPPELIKYLKDHKDHILNSELNKSKKGLIKSENSAMMIAVRPITNSKADAPIKGYLLMGRYLEKEEVDGLAYTSQLQMSILDTSMVSYNILSKMGLEKEPHILITCEQWLETYSLLKDIHDSPVLVLKVKSSRDIYNSGLNSLNFYMYSLVAVAAIFSVLIVFLLHQMILRRIQHLTATFHKVINNGDLTQRAKVDGRDEIAYLALTTNKLFDSLKTSQEDLQYASYHDSLTGLLNRNSFELEIKKIADENNIVISIVVCDVDGLKMVNDQLGHHEGDNLLKLSANIIKQCFRTNDKIYRIGGDEFVVILPTLEETIVKGICERVKKTIGKYNETNTQLPVSISIGYALNSQEIIDMAALFKEADDKMYDQKYNTHNSTRKLMCKIEEK